MCGIAGIISNERDCVAQALRRATAALAHRGPDDEGIELFPFGNMWLGFGHRRLSILDLSPLGHQPMLSGPDGSWITFNGEIYNFAELRRELESLGTRFRSHSDTEVLLQALVRWGTAVLPRLQGMYAFGFYDPHKQKLILARDPAGIKPLYIHDSQRGLVFASEVRAVLESGLVPRTLDRGGIAGMLAYGAVQHPRTLFSAIRSLPPGTHQEFTVNGSGQWRAGEPIPFWNYPKPDPRWTTERAIPAIRETLEAAVRDHMVADVPVGLFLSSGLDSTILAGLAAKVSKSIWSFTMSFGDHPEFDEASGAEATAKAFGLKHTTISLGAEEAERAAGDWLTALDQPSTDGLNVYVISQAVRRQGIKVALTGLGADELFGGYPSFRDVPRLHRFAQLMRPFPKHMRRTVATLITARSSGTVRAKLRDMVTAGTNWQSLYLQRRRLLADPQLAALGFDPDSLGLDKGFLAPGALPPLDDVAGDSSALLSRLESSAYQGNMLLRDGDANGMVFGLEIRVPMLDQRLIDLAHAIPGSVRTPADKPPKWLLRRAFSDYLRPELLAQPKRGFVLPVQKWMQTSLKPICDEALNVLADLKLVDPAGIAPIQREFEVAPDSPSWSRLFALCVLGDYIRRTGGTL